MAPPLRFLQRLTIRSQILLLVLVVVLPTAAAVGWALAAVLASEREAATARIRATATQVASNLGLLLRERDVQLARLASRAAQPHASSMLCAMLAAEFSRLSADLAALEWRDADGGLRCSTAAQALAAVPMGGSAWFKQAQAGDGLRTGPAMPAALPGGWTAPLAYPVRGADSQLVGVLVLPLDLPTLLRLVMPPPMPADMPAMVSVIDGNDALLMRSVPAPEWLGKPPPPALAARAASARPDAVLVGDGLDGVRRLFVFSSVRGTDWRVVVGVPEQAVLAHHQRLLRNSLAAGALGLLLLLGLAWRLSRGIVRPIQALAATSARVAAGDTAARADVAGPLELQAVATRFNHMLGANHDAHQTLLASEAQHRFLIDHLFAGVVVHAPDTSVLMCNARASALLGLSVAQMQGRVARDPAWRFVREDGSPKPVDEYPVVRVIRSGQALTDQVGGIDHSANSARVWVLLNAHPQFHADGSLRQVVVSFVDITARKLAEQSLASSESRYRLLFERSLDGVLQTRPDGTVLAANPAACAMYGLSEAELRARGRGGLVDAHDPRLQRLLQERAEQGHVKGQIGLCRADGSVFEAEFSSSIYTGPDGQELASVVVRDISQRVADEQARQLLEAQLRAAQKMEAVGTLAGGIAHDFNNILGGLLGNAALASQGLPSGHAVQANLAQISRAGQRARTLVQQILAFSRRGPQARVRLTLRPLVEETLALLRAALPAGLQIDADFGPDAGPTQDINVLADATQIQQVLMNLCTNAWHALDGPGLGQRSAGRIQVRLRVVTLGAGPSGQAAQLVSGRFALLQVEDNGAGMDEATQARIFEPFFTTKPIGQGTGLGLAVAHGIVAAHQGEIVVHSQPGQGSRFDVYLPLADSLLPQPLPGNTLPPTPGSGQHVLYVDDDEVMQLMVQQLLQRAGYRATVLGGAAPAMQALADAAQPIDLLVTDFNMPDGSGIDVARAALAARPGLPVVLSSGHLPDDLRTQALAMGVRAVLHKEHTVDELPALIGRLLA